MNIGIMGLAGSGKDTAGKWLVDNRGYERVAFADPLKEAALKVDPLIEQVDMAFLSPGEAPDVRLSEIVNGWGWARAKDDAPEVRRFLQELGASIRALDEDFWLRQALKKAADVNETTGRPVVITDVRYPNEVAALRKAGWHLVYIDRPGTPRMAHESEQLTEANADYLIQNFGFLEDFHNKVERFWERVNRFETRREDARALPFT
ncbi:deoxynucleotide monophosphate kinase family protein [Streptomyces lydicus]|uniref:deoxynucleotide monophosphate kinase family protein n=1 Tax=Streptomyces lydicus TaxID=47763 RepID=UPI0037A01176